MSSIPRVDNTVISWVLRSPLHRLLSGMVILIRYPGRRSGRVYTIPVQYVEHDEALLVAAFRAESKQWWRNVAAVPTVEVLHRRQWGEARVEVMEGDAYLVNSYTERFKSARRQLGEEDVFLLLSPRPVTTWPPGSPSR